jgi:hypothetical protein
MPPVVEEACSMPSRVLTRDVLAAGPDAAGTRKQGTFELGSAPGADRDVARFISNLISVP